MDGLSHILSQQWLWGTVVGAGLTYLGQWIVHQSQRRAVRRVAAMQIATQLRAWLRICAKQISDIRLHDDSDGHGGELHYALPKPPFEDSMDRVSELKPDDACTIFELIHGRDALHDAVISTAEMTDADEASDLFRGCAAKMYLGALPIYTRLARRAGWKTDPFPPWEIAMMHDEVERRRKRAAAESESRLNISADIPNLE